MLELKSIIEQHADFCVEHLNNAQVTQYLSERLPSPYTIEDALWWINIGSKQQAINRAIYWQGEMCGVIGVYLQSQSSAEIGYWLAPTYWNKGIASNAVTVFCSQLFAQTDIKRIVNPVSAPNLASIRVMEKAGFEHQKTLTESFSKNGATEDEHLYVLHKRPS